MVRAVGPGASRMAHNRETGALGKIIVGKTSRENSGIQTRAAVEPIVPAIAPEHVVAAAAEKALTSEPTHEGVVAAVAKLSDNHETPR